MSGTFLFLKPRTPFAIFPGLLLKLGDSELIVTISDSEAICFDFYEGPAKGMKLEHNSGLPPLVIGRKNPDLRYLLSSDVAFSGEHAKVYFDPLKGFWCLEDLDSCNGTMVRLSWEREVSGWFELTDSDIISVGNVRIRTVIQPDEKKPRDIRYDLGLNFSKGWYWSDVGEDIDD